MLYQKNSIGTNNNFEIYDQINEIETALLETIGGITVDMVNDLRFNVFETTIVCGLGFENEYDKETRKRALRQIQYE